MVLQRPRGRSSSAQGRSPSDVNSGDGGPQRSLVPSQSRQRIVRSLASASHDPWGPDRGYPHLLRVVREEPEAGSAVLQLLGKRGTGLDEKLRREAATAIWRDLVSDQPPLLNFRLIK